MNGTMRRGLDQAPATPDLWKERWDVVIVGARVAGATTALHLARAGHRVLIVDRAGPPKDTVSTHALMRSGVLQLRKLGVLERIIEAGTPAIRQINLIFGSQQIKFPVAEAFGVDAYYAPRRTLLDTVLLEAAIDAGATFLDGSVSGVSNDSQGRVNGVVVRTATSESTVGARWVVGADGTHSRVARSVGAQVLRYHPPTNGLVYAVLRGSRKPRIRLQVCGPTQRRRHPDQRWAHHSLRGRAARRSAPGCRDLSPRDSCSHRA